MKTYVVTGASCRMEREDMNSWCNYYGRSKKEAEKIFNEEVQAALNLGWTVVKTIERDWLVQYTFIAPNRGAYANLALRSY